MLLKIEFVQGIQKGGENQFEICEEYCEEGLLMFLIVCWFGFV